MKDLPRRIIASGMKIDIKVEPWIVSGSLKQVEDLCAGVKADVFRDSNIKPIEHNKNHFFSVDGKCSGACVKDR